MCSLFVNTGLIKRLPDDGRGYAMRYYAMLYHAISFIVIRSMQRFFVKCHIAS